MNRILSRRKAPRSAPSPWLWGIALASALASPTSHAADVAGRLDKAISIDSIRLSPGAGPGETGTSLSGVVVAIELLNAESRGALNGESAELLIDDDCNDHRLRLRRVKVYRLPHQGGLSNDASTPAEWLLFSSHSYAAQIAEAVCARRGELLAETASGPTLASPSPSPGQVSPSPSPSVRNSIPGTETRVVPQPRAVPVLAPAPVPVATAAAPVPVPAPAPAPGSASKPVPSPPPPGGILIQYLSTTSEAELERARDNLREQLGEHASRLTFSTARAVVRGVTRYRGRIGLFPGSAEARAFCVTVRRTGFACLVLPDAGNR